MTEIKIDVEGLEEAQRKMGKFPNDLGQLMGQNMKASLDVLWENVPRYPPQVVPPEVYRRTGSLGRSLGSGQGGGKSGGRPTVYGISQQIASGTYEGQFGTNLSYAKYVIDPKRQAYMHRPGYKGRAGWWTMDTIKAAATNKINALWQRMVDAILRKW